MGLSAMNPFIGTAEGTDGNFHVFHEGMGKSVPALPGMPAHGAEFAQSCQEPVTWGDVRPDHDFKTLPTEKACPRIGPTPWYPLWEVS